MSDAVGGDVNNLFRENIQSKYVFMFYAAKINV